MPTVGDHLKAKYYVDRAISNGVDERNLVTRNQGRNFVIFSLTNRNSFTFNTQLVHKNQVVAKSDVNQFHQRNDWSRTDLGVHFCIESNDLVKTDHDNNFNDYRLISLVSFTVRRDPSSINKLPNRKYIENKLEKVLLSHSINHYKTISKYLIETVPLILLNMIKDK